MRIKLFIILMFFSSYKMSAQICSIETMEICAGQEVFLPVYGKSLQSLGALTLYIGYDTINLSYQGIENINPLLSGMSTNQMSFPTQLAFAWSSTEPISFLDEKLFDLKFLANGYSAYVNYNAGCELSDTGGIVIPASYINGAVNSGLPMLLVQPHDTTVFEGDDANFYMVAENVTNFSWRESQDNGVSWITLDDNEIYSGTSTNHLRISAVPYSFNNNLYQGIAYHNNCEKRSTLARLNVDKYSGSAEQQSTENITISMTPMPFNDRVTLSLRVPKEAPVEITIFNMEGKIVRNYFYPTLTEGIHYINIYTSDWTDGLYFLRMRNNKTTGRSEAFLKMIRNK